jgi:TRAP transporter TAXI family solute receptor
MKSVLKNFSTLAGATALAAMLTSTAHAEMYKVTSIAPGMSPFVVNTSIAKVVAKHLPEVEMQVRATGAATRHLVEAGQGKVDFFFGSPTINWLMDKNIGPFKNMANAPQLEDNLGMIFSYEIGPYHYVVNGDSDIQSLADLKGKKVFLGPPGGAARGVVSRNVKAITGLTDADMDVQNFGFDAAIQAFQDGKIDLVVLPTNVPSPSIQQFALTKNIRLLDIPVDQLKIPVATGGTVVSIAPDAYGDNQLNNNVARTHGALVNFSARMDLDEEVVYQVTKTIWENLGELTSSAEWMANIITLENALQIIPNRLHPGAERYYREIGLDIPTPITY